MPRLARWQLGSLLPSQWSLQLLARPPTDNASDASGHIDGDDFLGENDDSGAPLLYEMGGADRYVLIRYVL